MTKVMTSATRRGSRWVLRVRVSFLWGALSAAACIPVRPEQRGILSDPMMRFDQERAERAKAQVLENREGSIGGGTVRGGGCGCN